MLLYVTFKLINYVFHCFNTFIRSEEWRIHKRAWQRKCKKEDFEGHIPALTTIRDEDESVLTASCPEISTQLTEVERREGMLEDANQEAPAQLKKNPPATSPLQKIRKIP